MKKRKNRQADPNGPNKNPVAKFAPMYNKAQTYRDKTKYNRKLKHIGQEADPMVFGNHSIGLLRLAS